MDTRTAFRVLVAAGAAAAGGLGCATVPVADCRRLPCTSAAACVDAGYSRLDAGEPDEAVCYFERALSLDRRGVGARLGKGAALAVSARGGKALREFNWVLKHSTDPEARMTALRWSTVINRPVAVAVYCEPARGCGDADGSLVEYAGSVLRHNLPKFGPFRAAGRRAEAVDDGIDAESLRRRAVADGAEIAVTVRLACGHAAARAGLAGDGRTEGLPVAVEIRAVRVAEPGREESLVGAAATRGGDGHFAILMATNRAFADVILRLSCRLAMPR